MDLEVVGCHALLFDDDDSASFVNSASALVDWNSLSIDRYDVRHLLSSLPPRGKRRLHSPPRRPDSPSESDLDRERFLDLPENEPTDNDDQIQDLDYATGPVSAGGYRAVPFSYGSADEPAGENNANAESAFRPPFSLPENLLQNLPPTEKVHQIIARTAMFVNRHGGQSEIVLRVKQGDNPTFGFLMPDHHLHAYFRFLVDHPELLSEQKKTEGGLDQTGGSGRGGALSLLGSVYGSGEDEDGADIDASEFKRTATENTVETGDATAKNGSGPTNSCIIAVGKDETVSNHSLPPKEKVPLIKKNHSVTTVKTKTSSQTKSGDGALGSAHLTAEKVQASALASMPKVERTIVEPPSDMKKVVDKIVEFILRNGKEFESVLVEQDRKYGRFPFLLPTSLFHPYYLKVLHKAEESKMHGKGFSSERHDSTGFGVDKKRSSSKERESLSSGSDIPYDDKKEKFKMVISKSKKDAPEPQFKAPEINAGVTVDTDAVAAILQAATRGIRNPNIDLLTRLLSSNGSSEGGQMIDQKGAPSVSVPVAKSIAKSAAIAASGEVDSSEANLSGEQKLKAERLKRAKMFAAMIKTKATASVKTETSRGLSVDPPESGPSGSGAHVNFVDKEREGSSVPMEVDASDVIKKSEKDIADDHERRSKRSYRSRSNRNEEELEELESEEEEEKERKEHKHSRRKRKSDRSSSHEPRDRDRKRHSERRHKHDDSSDHDNHRHSSKHRHKYDSMFDDDNYPRSSRDQLSDNEHRSSHHRHKHESHKRRHRHEDSSSEEEHHKEKRSSSKHRRKSHSKKELDLEEGEIKSDQSKASESYAVSREASVDLPKTHQVSREASVDISKVYQDARAPSQTPDTSEVSDELRAKIRAMLMATL